MRKKDEKDEKKVKAVPRSSAPSGKLKGELKNYLKDKQISPSLEIRPEMQNILHYTHTIQQSTRTLEYFT